MSDIDIIKETQDWLVLDKGAGISVHNRDGEDLVSFIRSAYPDLPKAFPINRLDAGTMGLVLFAKNAQAAKFLQQSFEQRRVKKTYLARVEILKNPPEAGDEGLWRWPLTNRAEGRRDPKGFWKRRIPCQTKWKVQGVHEGVGDLEIELLTGRKHQIRRHGAIYGRPILGDPRYGPKEGTSAHGSLIAKSLVFTDPASQAEVEVTSRFNLS